MLAYKSPKSSLWAKKSWSILPIIVLALLLAFSFWAYQLGSSGGWHFDDEPNLWQLSEVENLVTGLSFTMSGGAGPTGRPVSLLTFALQANAWPDDPQRMIYVNIAIHTFNVFLVFLVTLKLCHLLGHKKTSSAWCAVATSACWGLSPFLASGVLMAIQRMTLLSASFLFLGLLTYLLGRTRLKTEPKIGLALMVIGLVLGTTLATLAKENGALLPILVLVVELFLFRQISNQPKSVIDTQLPRTVKLLLLGPAILIVVFVVYRGLAGTGYEDRPFTLAQRLLSQSRVMWDYLINLLLPRSSALSPFTDDYPVSAGLLTPWYTLLAIFGLLGLIACATLLRRWSLLPLFAISWFFLGHLIESSFIALEIYFPHRNYVPSFGIFFAINYAIFFSATIEHYRTIAISGISGFVLVSGIVLASGTSLWGNPRLASEMWYINHGDSVRAAQYVARAYYSEGDPHTADGIVERNLGQHPDNTLLAIQSLTFCHISTNLYNARIDRLKRLLENSEQFGMTAARGLYFLTSNRVELGCTDLSNQAIEDILALVIRDPGSNNRDRLTQNQLAYAKASLARSTGDSDEVIRQLKRAFKLDPRASTAINLAFELVVLDRKEEAVEFLNTALQSPPANFLKALAWKNEIEEYLSVLQDQQL